VALVVLDASAIIAFLDPGDALHHVAIDALAEHQHDDLLIPLTVYAEILVGPYRRGAQAVAEIEAFVRDFAIRIDAMSPAIARAAARLRSQSRGLRLPDALVLATADERAADVVLTGDDSWAGISSRVVLIQQR
jgi:predicted nucleic acid-binding protein